MDTKVFHYSHISCRKFVELVALVGSGAFAFMFNVLRKSSSYNIIEVAFITMKFWMNTNSGD